MRSTSWIAAIPAVCLFVSQARADSGFALDKKRRVLQPITYKNLTLMPVVAKGKKGKDFVVLDEGMSKGVVKVKEVNADGTVNALVIENGSDQPLFLMAGEVIIGGKQDRIIGKDTIVPPKTKEPVPVFCVEHGRWSGRKASFEATEALAHTNLRMKAKYADQSAVWREVSAKNAMRSTENATDTYRMVAKGKGVKNSVKGYDEHFSKALGKLDARRDMVGFVVVLNGNVVAIETFRSPGLFHKLKRKLLRSYYVEAVDQPVTEAAKKKPKPKAIKSFARKAKSAKRKVVRSAKGGKTYQLDAEGVVGTSVSEQPATSPASPAEEPEAVYESVYAQ
jgi:hypothetical protein